MIAIAQVISTTTLDDHGDRRESLENGRMGVTGSTVKRFVKRRHQRPSEFSLPTESIPIREADKLASGNVLQAGAAISESDFPPEPQHYYSPAFHTLQEWEGYVTKISETNFTARLIDLTAGQTHESKEADIPIEEVSDNDIDELKIGSLFNWLVGYERSITGTKKRVSMIVFRNLPADTRSELNPSSSLYPSLAGF